MKKILSLILAFAICFTAVTLASCKKETAEYKVEFYIGGYYHYPNNDFHSTLTEESPIFEKTVGVYPFAQLQIQANFKIVEYKVNDRPIVKKIIYPALNFDKYYAYLLYTDENNKRIDTRVKYSIEEEDGSIIPASFINAITTTEWSRSGGYVNLEKRSGKHVIEYTFPRYEEYDIDETTFTVKLNVEQDERADSVEIVAENYEQYSYTLIPKEKTGDFDMYLMDKSGYTPAFVFKFKDQNEYGPEDGEISMTTHKIGEDYHFTEFDIAESVCQLDSGVYLCEVYYYGSTRYQSVNYMCYVVIPE